jgi:hypothetical protein
MSRGAQRPQSLSTNVFSAIDRVVFDIHVDIANTCGSGTMHGNRKSSGGHVPCEALLLRSSARKLQQVPYSIKRAAAGDPSLDLRTDDWKLVVAPHFPVQTTDQR